MAQLTTGVSLCRQYFGSRFVGLFGLAADLLAEGALSAAHNAMPGHPDQAPDAVDQCGADEGLFRYRNESDAQWKARVANPWPVHEQSGTDINLLREIDTWGTTVYPATWVAGQAYILEPSWARFTIVIPAGSVPWGGPAKFDAGNKFNDGTIYDAAAPSSDIAALRRIVRKWKPSRSRAGMTVIISGVIYDEPGIKFDSGAKFDAVTLRLHF